MILGCIVEGHGETQAVPVLARRIMSLLAPGTRLEVLPPLRLPRGKMEKEPELKRAVELMARKVGPGQPVLILLDADHSLACELGPRLLAWAREARGDHPISVVVAVREFEAWFLAAASSLAGKRGWSTDATDLTDSDCIASPKAWLNDRMQRGYTETLDQPAFADAFDLEAARKSASFDKLLRDFKRLIVAALPKAIEGA